MKSTARLLVTLDCPRQCENCCNKYAMDHMTRISRHDAGMLTSYNAVVITGGEPMSKLALTWSIIKKLKESRPETEVFLQTAWIKRIIKNWDAYYTCSIMSNINGITITVHDDDGLPRSLYGFLHYVRRNRRLRVAPGVTLKRFDVRGFDSIEFIEFVNDDSCVRSDEDLYLLED